MSPHCWQFPFHSCRFFLHIEIWQSAFWFYNLHVVIDSILYRNLYWFSKKKECVQTFSQIWIVLYRCNHWKQLSCFHGYVDVMECLLLRMHDFISFFLSSNFQCDIIQWSKWFVEMRILLGFLISPLLLNITWNLPVPLNYSQSSVVFVPEKNKPSFLNSIYWK